MEYFIIAESFAAPFCSDSSTAFQEAPDAAAALELFAKGYRHPCGLYSANAYESADAMHKGSKPLAKWLCNHELEKQRLTKHLPAYRYMSGAPGKFEVDGKGHEVANPKMGRVVRATSPKSGTD